MEIFSRLLTQGMEELRFSGGTARHKIGAKVAHKMALSWVSVRIYCMKGFSI